VPASAVPDVAADNLDLVVLALLGLFATGGFVGAFYSLLKTGKPPGVMDVPVTLLIPATGSGVDLARLATSISAQWLTPQRTVFIVESVEDPAYGRLKQALAGFSGAAEIFVAGLASASAQKSHNLARALARYDDGSRIIVLADADIVPQPHWLADIVQPLARGRARMVSGYRWALPMDCRLGTLIGAWTERAVASLPKPPWYILAWGGSLGFAPGTPADIGAVPVLERAVSDDISLAHAARRNGIDVLYRKRLLVPTPVSHSLGALLRFGLRQYQMLRLHQRAIWWTVLPVVALAVVLKSWLWWHAFTSAFWLQVLVAFLAATYATYGLRLLRARRLECWTVASRRAEAALLIVPLFGPVADAVNLAALLAGWSTARVDWAHCSYELDSEGRVVAIERRPWVG
jgi:hypothetical protein